MNTDLPPLDPDVRALVKRAARIGAAPSSAKLAVFARVESVVGPFGGGGGGGGGAADESRLASQPLGLPSQVPLLRRMLPLVASFALGGGVGVVASHRTAPPPTVHERPQIVYVERPVAAVPDAAEPPAMPMAPLRERTRTHSITRSPARPPAPPGQLTAERTLLDVGRAALKRDDPGAALDATSEHQRQYPEGILVQEREAMAIRALMMLNRGAEARLRAKGFRTRFPESLLLPTIESTAGGQSRDNKANVDPRVR